MKKCLKTFVRENNIKFPLSEEMLLYYLSLGYTCVCRQKVTLDYYVYTRIRVKDVLIHNKEFLSCVKLKPLSRSDIRFLIKNLTDHPTPIREAVALKLEEIYKKYI